MDLPGLVYRSQDPFRGPAAERPNANHWAGNVRTAAKAPGGPPVESSILFTPECAECKTVLDDFFEFTHATNHHHLRPPNGDSTP